VVSNRRLVAASAMEGELRRGGDGRWGRGGETVRGSTSPDDGVPTYGIYSAAARGSGGGGFGYGGRCEGWWRELAVGLETFY
jgi:hypothetical protein